MIVHVADARFELSAGDFALMPRGLPHAYQVRSAAMRALVSYAPAGFERFFVDNGRVVEDPERTPPPFAEPDGALRCDHRRGAQITVVPPSTTSSMPLT